MNDYVNEVKDRLRWLLRIHPHQEVEDYLDALTSNIEQSYYDSKRLSSYLGSDQISVSSYCYGIMMLYPDLP